MMSRIRLYLENIEDTEDARVGADRRDVPSSERSERCSTDQSSGVVRIRAAQIRSIVEVTPEQRTTERKLYRALRLEQKADRRAWEDDD